MKTAPERNFRGRLFGLCSSKEEVFATIVAHPMIATRRGT